MHARLVMPVLEGQNETPAIDDLDDVMEKLDMNMATQLMKAAAFLHATNAVKRSGCSAARTNVVLRIVVSTITVVFSVSSLPLYFCTMTSHRDIYIYNC
jgi:hypothetical protein